MPLAPLNLYISHAPEDRPALNKLLRWLRPLEQQYLLRIWYNVPVPPPAPVPLVWRLLFFWYSPPPSFSYPWHPNLGTRVAQAHIYLFLTSYKSISTPWIEEREVIPAVQRYGRLGPGRVRIFPVLVSPSRWEESSRLGAFRPLGPPKALSVYQPDDEAYLLLVRQLEKVIVELQRNQTERLHLLDRAAQVEGAKTVPDDTFLPEVDDFSRTSPYEAPAEHWPLPGWLGSVIVLMMFWLLYLGFEPYVDRWRREIESYRPIIESEPPPVEFPREGQLQPPPYERPLNDSTEFPSLDSLRAQERPLDGIEPD